jgi:hypothetical protein
MMSIVQRFLSFDRLVGPVLVKIIYFVAVAGIVLFVVGTVVAGIFSMFSGNVGAGLMQIVAAPAVGAVLLVYWRFLCEFFLITFLQYERLGEVRDLLAGGAPKTDHPQF